MKKKLGNFVILRRRPSVRENAPQLGDLLNDFDFTQSPLPPLILPTDPPPGPASIP